jgi:hypothetical protein
MAWWLEVKWLMLIIGVFFGFVFTSIILEDDLK